jgi:hypothetical protein
MFGQRIYSVYRPLRSILLTRMISVRCIITNRFKFPDCQHWPAQFDQASLLPTPGGEPLWTCRRTPHIFFQCVEGQNMGLNRRCIRAGALGLQPFHRKFASRLPASKTAVPSERYRSTRETSPSASFTTVNRSSYKRVPIHCLSRDLFAR